METPEPSQPTLTEQVEALARQGLGVTEIAKRLNKPKGSVSPLLSRMRQRQVAHASGAAQQAHSAAHTQPQTQAQGKAFSSPPAALRSPEERSRVAALKLLAKISREGFLGNRKFDTDTARKEAWAQMRERVDAAKSLIAKVKAQDEDDEGKATAYSAMPDEELADHVITSAAASLGVARLRDVLDRLEREGLLIKSPGEHAAAAAEVMAGLGS